MEVNLVWGDLKMWEVNLSVELEWLPLSSLCLGKGTEYLLALVYSLLTETFAFLAILFTVDIFVTRSPLCFKCKGMLLPTPTLFQVKVRFNCHATRQDSQKIEAALGVKSLSSEFPEVTSLRSDTAHHPDVTLSEPFALYVLLLQSMWSTMLLFLQTFIVSTINILTRYSSFISLL